MPTNDLLPIRKNGVTYVAMTPARVQALRLGVEGIDTWLSEFDHFPKSHYERAKKELATMIAEMEVRPDANQ